MIQRGENKRLIIETPPRHGKSELVSRKFPSFYLAHQPRHEFISASYGATLATNFGREVRNTIASKRHQALFPALKLAEDSQSKNEWHTNWGGSFYAVGVGGGTTGRGANVLNIDDPVKDRAEAESPVFRQSVWDWFTSVAYTRLMPGGAIIVTMTRWHEDDLVGRLDALEAEGGEKWRRLILPAINADGTALWPEAYPLEDLKRIRETIGERDWASLYEQRPRPVEGSFFTEADMLVDGQPIPLPAGIDVVFATIDSATKTGTANDGTGVIYWGLNRTSKYPLVILDWDIVQIEGALLEVWLPSVYARLEELSRDTRARMGSLGCWIEDKASGMILLQQAARRGMPAQGIDSKLTSVGKTERAVNVSGYVFRKMVKFSKDAYERVKTYKGRTRNHLLAQVLAFRVGTKDMGEDDLLDCFSYGVAIGLGDAGGF